MQFINALLDWCKKTVKGLVRPIAQGLNTMSGGHLSPHTITFIGLIMHLPIAVFVATNHPIWAGVLLIVFGLFDTLDGELARLQGSESAVGMMLDSTTDRMKEIILYMGIAYFLVSQATSTAQTATIVVAAAGGSILVSYINAWGEAVLASRSSGKHRINSTFRGGLMRFEVRMFLLVFGLLTGWLWWSVAIIAVAAWLTAFERLNNVVKRLA
jgi:CDP-diacylglycerol---glycerol-3-phosphate 3-phosphatidyltransferase